MEKRLTRSDTVFLLLFIFMLICAIGAFFYGVQVGTDRTETKYASAAKAQEEASKTFTAYHQTYLVSYYHTIYLPNRDFQSAWFKAMNDLQTGQGSSDPAAMIKELGKLADDKYDAVANQSMPESSPLLKEAHQNVMKSLKLFSQAAKSFQSKANALKGNVLLDELGKDANFAEAKNYALLAQKGYYDSIVKWNESVTLDLKGLDLLAADKLSLADWGKLNLNLKNAYLAQLQVKDKLFQPFTPQDLAERIDETIKSEQAKKMNADSIPQLAELLVGTGAVRAGDFLNGKAKYYTNEQLPQLPFFTN